MKKLFKVKFYILQLQETLLKWILIKVEIKNCYESPSRTDEESL